MNVKVISKIIMALIVFLDIYSKIPQIRTLLKYKVSAGISVKSYAIWNLSSALYIIYCLLIKEVPLLIETLINLGLNTMIALLAWKYRRPLITETADEIFKSLGYEKCVNEHDELNHIIARYEKELDVPGEKNVITFNEDKYFRAEYKYKDLDGNKQTAVCDLTAEETLAVNRKIKEFRWR